MVVRNSQIVKNIDRIASRALPLLATGYSLKNKAPPMEDVPQEVLRVLHHGVLLARGEKDPDVLQDP